MNTSRAVTEVYGEGMHGCKGWLVWAKRFAWDDDTIVYTYSKDGFYPKNPDRVPVRVRLFGAALVEGYNAARGAAKPTEAVAEA